MNLLGVLGSLSRMLPGFVQGERQAIQDNWADLNNYEKVRAAQVQNLYDEQVFNPRVTREYDLAASSQIGLAEMAQQAELNRLNRGRQYRWDAWSSVYDRPINELVNAGRYYGAQQSAAYARMPPNPYAYYYGQTPPVQNFNAFAPNGAAAQGVQNLPSALR